MQRPKAIRHQTAPSNPSNSAPTSSSDEESELLEQQIYPKQRTRADSLGDIMADKKGRVFGASVQHIRNPSSSNNSSSIKGNRSSDIGGGTPPVTLNHTSDPSEGRSSSIFSEESKIKISKKEEVMSYPKMERFTFDTSSGGTLILTGREKQFTRCEDEPLHAPGNIQSFGALICCERIILENQEVIFEVKQVSENSINILGVSPSTLFQAKSLLDFFNESEVDDINENLSFLMERDADISPEATDDGLPIRFELTGRGFNEEGVQGKEWKSQCSIHQPPPLTANRFIFEFELVDSSVSRSRPTESPFKLTEPVTDNFDSPDLITPADSGYSAEDVKESTTTMISPLPELIRLRRQRDKVRSRLPGQKERPFDFHLYNLLSDVNAALNKALDLNSFLRIVAGIFRELTEYDRVMVYQFDDQFAGQVVAENVDLTKTNDIFKGLWFPSTDIPPQARALYIQNRLRILVDRDAETARLVCRNMKEIDSPLDLSKSFLRAVSPIHLQYLRNMSVKSTMAASIMVDGKFWGMVVSHGYGEAFKPSNSVRDIARLLTTDIGVHIERLELQERIKARSFINTTPSASNPRGYIAASAEDLLALFKADFGCLSIGEEAKILGSVEDSQDLITLLAYFRSRVEPFVRSSHEVAVDYPDIGCSSAIAGFFVVPLSRGGKDFIIFVRGPRISTIRWAGSKVSSNNKENVLEPRKSFKTFVETLRGKSASWSDVQCDMPQILLLIFGRFIDVWRQNESLLSARKLAGVLLQSAGEAVRNPLNEIINHLELALGKDSDGNGLDQDTKDSILNSRAASQSLLIVINDLLSLTKAESNPDVALTSSECFVFNQAIADGTDPFAVECKNRGIRLEVLEQPTGTPVSLIGDKAKVTRIISELMSNAIRFTKKGGSISVVWGEIADETFPEEDEGDLKADSIKLGICITDTGSGIGDKKLELLFRELEHITQIDPVPLIEGEKNQERVIGLGLSLVARTVSNLKGQVRISSDSSGSIFQLVLPFSISNAVQSSFATPSSLLSIAPASTFPSGSITSNLARFTPSETSHATSNQSKIDGILESLMSENASLSTRLDLGPVTAPLSRLNLVKNSLLNLDAPAAHPRK